ncbi:MAG: restriction endonuclease subunit S [Candidatus Methylumidiphilus sp.]
MIEKEKGVLPEGWRRVKLEDICEIISGQSPPGNTYRNIPEGLPFFQGKADFGEKYPFARTWCVDPVKFAQPGDILISVRAPVGPTNIADVECCIGRGLAAIRGGNLIDKDFLYLCLKSLQEDIAKMGSGSTFQAITRDNLSNINIPLPPLPEQKRIAAILKEQLAAVEQARKASEARLEAARALSAAYLREVFESEEIKKWKINPLGNLVSDFRYGTSNKSSSSGYVTLRIPNVIGNTLNLKDIKTVPVSVEEQNRLRLFDGDILFVRTNGSPDNVGRSAVFDSTILEGHNIDSTNVIFASYLIRARLNTKIILPNFLQTYLQSRSGRQAMLSRCMTSAGQYNINIQGLSNIPIPTPSLEIQDIIIDKLKNQTASYNKIDKYVNEELILINSLAPTLLSRAFNGVI